MPSTQTDRSVLTIKKAWIDAAASYIGDLIIEIPEQCYAYVQNQKVMKINIDLYVSGPSEVGNQIVYSQILTKILVRN